MHALTRHWHGPPHPVIVTPMPDDLYDRDVLAWSERQADMIRRLARGERVNDVDWLHVAE